jgi:hypothetical protein
MLSRSLGLACVLLLGLATAGSAQEQQSVDAKRLGIDLARVQRELRQAQVREERDGLNLRYNIAVYGQAPRITLFTEKDNIKNGLAPYGGPTHREMMELTTPKEYRAPAADFSALMRWFADKKR